MGPQRLCLAASAATNSPRSARLPSSSPPALAQSAVLTGTATLARCGVGDKWPQLFPGCFGVGAGRRAVPFLSPL